MKTDKTSKALHSSFEKAVIDVVKYLTEHYLEHQKFRHKKELIARFGLSEQFYNKIQNGLALIPKDKWQKISGVLINEFGVNPSYLNTHVGDMFTNATNEVHEASAIYNTSHEQVRQLHVENKKLKEEIKRLEMLVETQADLIKMLKKNEATYLSDKVSSRSASKA